jgi:hypothetical protein
MSFEKYGNKLINLLSKIEHKLNPNAQIGGSDGPDTNADKTGHYVKILSYSVKHVSVLVHLEKDGENNASALENAQISYNDVSEYSIEQQLRLGCDNQGNMYNYSVVLTRHPKKEEITYQSMNPKITTSNTGARFNFNYNDVKFHFRLSPNKQNIHIYNFELENIESPNSKKGYGVLFLKEIIRNYLNTSNPLFENVESITGDFGSFEDVEWWITQGFRFLKDDKDDKDDKDEYLMGGINELMKWANVAADHTAVVDRSTDKVHRRIKHLQTSIEIDERIIEIMTGDVSPWEKSIRDAQIEIDSLKKFVEPGNVAPSNTGAALGNLSGALEGLKNAVDNSQNQ